MAGHMEPAKLTLDEVLRLATALDQVVPCGPPDAAALRNAARYYATQGWPVFPCLPGGKAPLTKRGLYDATVDLDQVDQWWSAWPLANIGLPTGLRFDVIDIDAPDGFFSFQSLITRYGAQGYPPPEVLAVSYTGSGGRHLLVPAQQGVGNGAGLAPGVDYRGRGGYIVAPPSALHGAGTYQWIKAPGMGLVSVP